MIYANAGGKTPKAFAYKIYSHFTQQIIKSLTEVVPGLLVIQIPIQALCPNKRAGVTWKVASMVENFSIVTRKLESNFQKKRDFNPFCMAHTYLPILYDNVKLGNLKLPVKLPPASTHSW